MTQIVDLSIFLENDVISDPPVFGRRSTTSTTRSRCRRSRLLPGPEKRGPAGRRGLGDRAHRAHRPTTARTSTRPITSPPTMNKGERAITIDEVPLEWCFQPGVKLDFRHLPDGYVVTADEVEDGA